jgi:hypothetical protein
LRSVGRVGDTIVSEKELAELSDEELVELIVARTGKHPATVREILTIIRDEIPEGTII